MLYRTARSTAAILRAALTRAIGFVAELRRTRADTTYLSSLNDNALKDLGIRRTDPPQSYLWER